MLIRFNYCPPSPGPNTKTNCRWYSDVQTLLMIMTAKVLFGYVLEKENI